MGRLWRFWVCLVGLTWGVAAPAQSGPEGYYITEIMETASGLELGADGRFRWAFTQGGLDLTAQGRWRAAEDGAVLLDTEPAVRPPTTELTGTGSERGRGVLVRIADSNGRTPTYLTVEAQYETGEPDYARIQGDVYRFDAAPGRRVVAVRVLIGWANYVSERFELPRGSNRVSLRFSPNDLGRADFRSERLVREQNVLVLNHFGEPLRYRRLSAEERAQRENIDDIATEAGAETMAEQAPLSPEDEANDRVCVNEGLRLERAVAIAGCTALIDSGRLQGEALATVRFNRGNLLTDDGQYAGALADFNEALRLNPDFGMAYWGRAGAYAGLRDRIRARADYREAARREPNDPTVLGSMCWDLAVSGEALDEARTACDSSLAIRPNDPDTLDSRGLVGLRQGRFREAWADYDAAVRAGADNVNLASFLHGRGIAARHLGRTAAAQADLARAATLTPTIAQTYAEHGVRP